MNNAIRGSSLVTFFLSFIITSITYLAGCGLDNAHARTHTHTRAQGVPRFICLSSHIACESYLAEARQHPTIAVFPCLASYSASSSKMHLRHNKNSSSRLGCAVLLARRNCEGHPLELAPHPSSRGHGSGRRLMAVAPIIHASAATLSSCGRILNGVTKLHPKRKRRLEQLNPYCHGTWRKGNSVQEIHRAATRHPTSIYIRLSYLLRTVKE